MSSTVSWSSEAVKVVVSAPSSARIRVTASGMCDVRLTALAHLAAVRGLGEDVRAAQRLQVRVRVVRAMGLGHMADRVRQPVPGGGPEQGGPAEPAQVEPGTAAPAVRTGRRPGIRGLRRLCTHGHLRLLRPAVEGTRGCRRQQRRPSGPVLDATDPTTRR